ncbi:MAG: site-specific integrase [Bacteroidota bacterium]|nr:site-specific integrase [Bacteroidota bacterium]
MAAVHFKIRSKENKNVSIKVRFMLGKKKADIELSTGFTINPKDWSEKNLPKQNSAENKVLINNLKKLESFIFENLNNDLANGVLIDSFWLQSQINDCFKRIEKTDTGLITNYLQDIINNAATRKVKVKGRYNVGLSKSRINSFVATKNIIIEFQTITKKQIHFIDISEPLIDKLTTWLLHTRKYAINTASKHIANIKTICIEAEKKGIQTNPYAKQIIVFSEKDEDRFIQTLSFEELETIRNADIPGQALSNARKWILLGCEFGQRGQDLVNITKDNFRYKGGKWYLDIIQQKTKKAVTIPVIAPYVIDIIENSFPYYISTQKLNTHIKNVCEQAELNIPTEGKIFDKETKRKELNFYPKHKLITTHSFRRSFASNYYKKIPTAILMNITGHSKESLFLTYINKPADKDDNADLFMKFYEEIHKVQEPVLKVVKTTN